MSLRRPILMVVAITDIITAGPVRPERPVLRRGRLVATIITITTAVATALSVAPMNRSCLN